MVDWPELEQAKKQKRKELDKARHAKTAEDTRRRAIQFAEDQGRRESRQPRPGANKQAGDWRLKVMALLLEIARAAAEEDRMSTDLELDEYMLYRSPEQYVITWRVCELGGGPWGYTVSLSLEDCSSLFYVECADISTEEHYYVSLPGVPVTDEDLKQVLVEAYRRGPGRVCYEEPPNWGT